LVLGERSEKRDTGGEEKRGRCSEEKWGTRGKRML